MMNKKGRLRITLNVVGPFIALPCLGEVGVSRNFWFASSWLLIPLAVAYQRALSWVSFSTSSWGLFTFFSALFVFSLAGYLAVSLAPFVRDLYTSYEHSKREQLMAQGDGGNRGLHLQGDLASRTDPEPGSRGVPAMRVANQTRIFLNAAGPFVALPCLGEIANGRIWYLWTWLLWPVGSFIFAENREGGGLFIIGIILITLFSYPLAAVFPFVRDGYRRHRSFGAHESMDEKFQKKIPGPE